VCQRDRVDAAKEAIRKIARESSQLQRALWLQRPVVHEQNATTHDAPLRDGSNPIWT
jgi:hypothetical protein